MPEPKSIVATRAAKQQKVSNFTKKTTKIADSPVVVQSRTRGQAASVEKPAVETQRQMRPRDPSITYAPAPRNETAYEDLLGTISDTLQRHIAKVQSEMDVLAPPQTRETTGRRNALVRGLIATPEFQDELAVAGMPTRGHMIVAEGVKQRLREYRDQGLYKTAVGRCTYNSLLDAALCILHQNAQHGDIDAVAAALGYSRQVLLDIRQRLVEKTLENLLDTARSIRSDAFAQSTLDQIAMAWEMFTECAPDLIAKFRTEPGVYVSHPVHYRRHSKKEIYAMMVEKIGRLCCLSAFKALTPYWVRKPGYASCLCPYCFIMSLLMKAYVILMKEVRDTKNTCSCEFCLFQKERARQGELPPRKATIALDMGCCKRPEAPPESGFKGKFPCHRLCCCIKYMPEKDVCHVHEKVGPVQECEACAHQYMYFPPPEMQCSFFNNSVAVVPYKRYVEVNRTGRLGKEGKKKNVLELCTVSRREFAKVWWAQFCVTTSHKYEVGICDGYSDRMTLGPLHADHTVEDIDFAHGYNTTPAEALKDEAFQTDSVSLHTMVTYTAWPPAMQPHVVPEVHRHTRMTLFCGVSDDPGHNSHYVHENLEASMACHHQMRHRLGMPPCCWKTIISDNGPHYASRNNYWQCCKGQHTFRPSALCEPCKPPGGIIDSGDEDNATGEDNAVRWRMADPPLDEFDWAGHVPHHGKGSVDGFNGSTKQGWRDGEKKLEHGNLHNAEKCVRYGNDHMYPCTKDPGEENKPFKPQALCHHQVEEAHFHLTDGNDLDVHCSQAPEVTRIEGTHTHLLIIILIHL